MKQEQNCKIVQDLLPTYIEKLTDPLTNEFIEEHVAKCKECATVLSDMDGDLQLEKINQDQEVKYLKKIRTRVKQTIVIVSLIILMIASGMVAYIYQNSKIQVNNYTFMRASYELSDKPGTVDGKLYGVLVAVFDERDRCISARIVEKGYDKREIQIRRMRAESNIESFPMNFQEEDGIIHYNINTWNNLSKDEVKENWITFYKVNQIEEI